MNKLYKSFIVFCAAIAFGAQAQVSQPVGPGGRPQTFAKNGVLIGEGTSNVISVSTSTPNLCLVSQSSADPAWLSCSTGAGTVTNVSGVNSNGFSWSIANPTTTPALTLSTSVTGLIKGNGAAMSAATSGTDYSAGTSALGTGIVKTTTGTGALTVAVAGDFPTLNQNTTGTASNVTGTVAVANGGTGLTATPTNGQIDIGNGTNFTRSTITGGTGITVTNGAGSITISASGATTTPGLVWLQTITPTATAVVDALTSFSATYDNYFIVYEGLKPSANDGLAIRVATSGTPDAGSNYYPLPFNGSGTATSTSLGFGSNILAAGIGANGSVTIQNVNSTGLKSLVLTMLGQTSATPGYANQFTPGTYTAASVVTGFRLFWGSGSSFVAQGSVKIYGYNN